MTVKKMDDDQMSKPIGHLNVNVSGHWLEGEQGRFCR